jgi:hypothetical protein
MTIKGRQGPAAALPEFVAATDADPSMADAWLGRIACGDTDLVSLKQLNATSEWLHRETTRIGRTLAAEIQLGPRPCGILRFSSMGTSAWTSVNLLWGRSSSRWFR